MITLNGQSALPWQLWVQRSRGEGVGPRRRRRFRAGGGGGGVGRADPAAAEQDEDDGEQDEAEEGGGEQDAAGDDPPAAVQQLFVVGPHQTRPQHADGHRIEAHLGRRPQRHVRRRHQLPPPPPPPPPSVAGRIASVVTDFLHQPNPVLQSLPFQLNDTQLSLQR